MPISGEAIRGAQSGSGSDVSNRMLTCTCRAYWSRRGNHYRSSIIQDVRVSKGPVPLNHVAAGQQEATSCAQRGKTKQKQKRWLGVRFSGAKLKRIEGVFHGGGCWQRAETGSGSVPSHMRLRVSQGENHRAETPQGNAKAAFGAESNCLTEPNTLPGINSCMHLNGIRL